MQRQTSRMQSPATVDSTTHNVEVFCHMVLEEFMTTRNMHSTLRAFRKEWDRPNEDVTMFSWYNLILKLQMSELLHENEHDENHTVLESLVKALAKESSIRTRRPVDVTISGMTSMPKVTTLPHLSDPQSAPPTFECKPRHSPAKEKRNIITTAKSTKNASRPQINLQQSTENSLIPSKLERIDKFGNGKIIKTSAENWLPDSFRMRSRMRELAMAQETLDGIILREQDQVRQQKRTAIPIYEKALIEESLAMVKKHPCGCCLQKYLYVNLPLKVSQKAIIDIRVKWTGGMTSATIFSGTRTMTAAATFDAGINTSMLSTMTPDGTKSPGNKGDKKPSTPPYQKMHVSRSSINVYDQVLVCLFCSQYFLTQEEYRPSYAEMVHSEKRANHLELLERERQYWDPLMMVEKDKKEEEDEKERIEYEALLAKSSAHTAEEFPDQNDVAEEV